MVGYCLSRSVTLNPLTVPWPSQHFIFSRSPRFQSQFPHTSRRDEQTLRATLNQVIGLKVYHLQQLSQTSLRDIDLSKDQMYLKLKSEIFEAEKLKSLSPAQLIAATVSLGRLHGQDKREWSTICNALKALSESSQYNMSPSQIGASLYAIARSGNCACTKDRFLVSILKRFMQESNQWSAIDMGWVLFFLRKKDPRDLPVWSRTIRQLAYRFNERLGEMTARNVACILSEFGFLRLLPSLAIHRALRTIQSNKAKLDMKTMCTLITALANLRVYRSDFLHSIAPECIDLISDPTKSTPSQTVLLIHSLSRLDWVHPGIIKAVASRVTTGDAILESRDIGMLAYAYGRLGIGACNPVWTRVTEHLSANITTLSPLNVSVIVSALGKVGYEDESLMEKVVKRVKSDLKAFTPKQIVNILNGLSNCSSTANGIETTDTMLTSRISEFQLNKVWHTLNPGQRDKPVMDPRKVGYLHKKFVDMLNANNVQDTDVNKQIGGVFVDVIFRSDGKDYAVLFLGDSDTCKLKKHVLLGPTKWNIQHVRGRGFEVITVRRDELRKSEGLDKIDGLQKFNAVCEWSKPRRGKPFRFDTDTGKISFTQPRLALS